jgi:hypothetical protein
MRDSGALALNTVISAVGGVRTAARLVHRSPRLIAYYLTAERSVSPDVYRKLAAEASALASALMLASHDLNKAAESADQRRARIKQASRERFYARFGHYPMPARGGKTG